MAAIVKEATEGQGLEGEVVEFDYGNSHFLITSKVFRDVRLVGAPPSAVGKFGGHRQLGLATSHGDFSVFRIYADRDNKPAAYASDNVPYTPEHHFPVDVSGVQDGDFTMVFGFPGRTEQYLTSDAVEHVIERLNPMRIAMRDEGLAVINAARASSDALRIAYAAKQSSEANAWKKRKGQNRGLTELHAIDKKRTLEAELNKVSGSQVVEDIAALNAQYFPFLEARSLFIELAYYGPEVLNYAHGFSALIEGKAEGEARESLLARLRGAEDGFRRDYDSGVDERLLGRLVEEYLKWIPADLAPGVGREVEAREAGWLGPTKSSPRVCSTTRTTWPSCWRTTTPNRGRSSRRTPRTCGSKSFVRTTSRRWPLSTVAWGRLPRPPRRTPGLEEAFPDRVFFVDANSTLRLTYGKVEEAPYDGMQHNPLSTAWHLAEVRQAIQISTCLRGLWSCWKRRNTETTPTKTATSWCASGPTTRQEATQALSVERHGAPGDINFDRSWESTMSDILFDGSRCRTSWWTSGTSSG